jgi:hypothetical protein
VAVESVDKGSWRSQNRKMGRNEINRGRKSKQERERESRSERCLRPENGKRKCPEERRRRAEYGVLGV